MKNVTKIARNNGSIINSDTLPNSDRGGERVNKVALALFILMIISFLSNIAIAAYTLAINEPEINPITEGWIHKINPLKITAREFLEFDVNTTRWQAINITIQNTDTETPQNAIVYVRLFGLDRTVIADNGAAGTQVSVPANEILGTGAIQLKWTGNYTAIQVAESTVTLMPQPQTQP